jgi:diaminohydroxyphosphoribosylaminopyrimidine deaminase/5-amino-6-(5-phosphoribosylamino)uracil reductase
VSGRGIKKIQEAGIKVVTNVLEKECQKLNEIFEFTRANERAFLRII